MNNLNNDTTKNVLDTQQHKQQQHRQQQQRQQQQQQQQQQQEYASENEESDTVTEQSSTASENAQKNDDGHHEKKKSSPSKSISTTATQFSVQRSDADGCLRMKISAIRPSTASTSATSKAKAGGEVASGGSSVQSTANPNSAEDRVQHNNNNNNNNSNKSLETLKVKKGSKAAATPTEQQDKKGKKAQLESANMSKTAGSTNSSNFAQQPVTNVGSSSNTSLPKLAYVPQPAAAAAACFSDVTDSDCSEATNTTITASNEKSSKRIKVKRKKAQPKNDSKRVLKKARGQVSASTVAATATATAFSTDSEDEPLSSKQMHLLQQHQHQHQQTTQSQRAPRLLLTAINTKSNALAPACSTATVSQQNVAPSVHGSDRIGLSSSDNELPDSVSAAIKRVFNDTDDEEDAMTSTVFPKTKSRQRPQYQSTLLQDFMEKTQMLGQGSTTPLMSGSKLTMPRVDMLTQSNTNSQSDSVTSGTSNTKKRRGRPKKAATSAAKAEKDPILSVNTLCSSAVASHINESADSGVISTTSISTQSTSPQPATIMTGSTTVHSTSPHKSHQAEKSPTDAVSVASSSAKPKIDIALLDKRMYATERVLYPPPRNKRRQSVSAAAAEKRHTTTSAATAKLSKEELQLDPVWRKIDVNKKFRRPSVASTGYRSDGGGGGGADRNNSATKSTICSKILAAKSGYVSDYGSSAFHARLPRHLRHNASTSGYKSDASCKSRYSTKSCASRRSRAKSCGYRSDCKESGGLGSGSKSSKFRRKHRASIVPKSAGTLKDEQDILQLAGLSLGQSSEESNEYVCKPSLEKLPTTSASKKYGEINRYIATGEYFGRGSSSGTVNTFASLNSKASQIFDAPSEHLAARGGGKLLLHQRKNSNASEYGHDLLQLPTSHTPRKIKSRRSSAASYCSSYYSTGTCKMKRRRRRRSLRFPISSSTNKSTAIDSKLLTEIEILTSTFAARCRIQNGSVAGAEKLIGSNSTQKEKLLAEASKLQQSLVAAAAAAAATAVNSSHGGKREARDKRALKKRKMSENLDFAMLSASAAASGLAPATGVVSKRRHKKASSSSPDDHKLPLKKRHYLLTPGEKSSEVAVAVAAKLFANNAEAWAAAAAAAKSTASTKSQQQFNAKTAKAGVTPKKRHLLQQSVPVVGQLSEDGGSVKTASNSSPLRVAVGCSDNTSISGGKLLDISPHSLNSLKQNSEAAVNKKRSRLEGLVTKIATNHSEDPFHKENSIGKHGKSNAQPQLDPETLSCPPPGVFEPSVELEIQIPPISKLAETPATIVTKSEVDSPLLLELNKSFPPSTPKSEGARVVETLLNKTGGNLLLRRKRKKINRTGFPTVRRKKRKISDQVAPDETPDVSEKAEQVPAKGTTVIASNNKVIACDRVPQAGETSDTFLERASRTPRLSVVALERLQGTPAAAASGSTQEVSPTTSRGRRGRTPNRLKARLETPFKQNSKSNANMEATTKAGRSRRSKSTTVASVLRRRDDSVKSARKTHVRKCSKPTLDPKVKLPAGIDPNTNFSCKIRLKRGRSLRLPSAALLQENGEVVTQEPMMTPEELEAEAAAKDVHNEQLEHEVLPLNEANVEVVAQDSEAAASDTSDEKSSTTSTMTAASGRKAARLKKTYLPAGLFSDFFKLPQSATRKSSAKKELDKKDSNVTSTPDVPDPIVPPAISSPLQLSTSLLPPPPYCEKYFRRTVSDFELPYDIWWAYKNCKLPTRITVPSWNYRKIRTNIYADSVRPPNMAANDHPTCNCKPDMGCGDNCLNRMVYTECSPSSCPTREKCRNQKIQRHEVAPGVERFMTENKGWGVRTKLPIPKGTYILEYVGEVVTEREFKDRMGTIYLNDTHHYCLHLDGGLVIDGHRMGSDGRFVNHSCQPNCEMQKWSVNGLSRMALFAKRNIAEGEELTYDYNFSLFNPSEGQPCRCNTPQCRGVIGGKSQRIKPLPVDAKPLSEVAPKEMQSGRQRKRKARKNMQRPQTKEVATATLMQPLTEKERKLVKQHGTFLLRNFEQIRRYKARRNAADNGTESKSQNLSLPNSSPGNNGCSNGGSAATVVNRRSSTPTSLAAQISALFSARNIKTRGLTLAVQDPEVEKMAKMALILRDICAALEVVQEAANESQTNALTVHALFNEANGGNKKKKATLKTSQKQEASDLRAVQANIEQGYYKLPNEFDEDMQKILKDAKEAFSNAADGPRLKFLQTLSEAYEAEKERHYTQLKELLGDESLLDSFKTKSAESTELAAEDNNQTTPTNEAQTSNCKETEIEIVSGSEAGTLPTPVTTEDGSTADAAAAGGAPANTIVSINGVSAEANSNSEDIISCICGLYKDEGLMIQCARCMVWQHTECTKADVNADNYLCEKCEPRQVDREIPLDDFTEEGHRYYLTLMRGADLQVRQGDTVYVLRDIPIKDADGNIVPTQKHTYETIGKIDYNECDIFRVERLWKNEEGKRFIFGHHFLRPHETFHEPSRRFYPNEVVRVPLYEVVPIELVIARCWVLDRTTFCKGRPIECNDEAHCYICELRVDKTARFFSKAKVNYPICTKSYAFRKFAEKLKISKTYAPHDIDPALLKTKKQKTDNDSQSANQGVSSAASTSSMSNVGTRQELNRTPQNGTRKRQMSQSPATVPQSAPDFTQATVQVVKEKRTRLENVLKAIKMRMKHMAAANEPPTDLTYLLTGRGARQRKALTSSSTVSSCSA